MHILAIDRKPYQKKQRPKQPLFNRFLEANKSEITTNRREESLSIQCADFV